MDGCESTERKNERMTERNETMDFDSFEYRPMKINLGKFYFFKLKNNIILRLFIEIEKSFVLNSSFSFTSLVVMVQTLLMAVTLV